MAVTVTTDAGPATPAGRRPRRGVRRGEVRGMPYLLILPGFIFYALFVLVPIADTVRLSFLEWDGLSPQTWVGLDNYLQVLTDPNTWTSLRVSLVFVVFGCVLPVTLALLLVGIIARTRIRGLSFFRFVFFLPYTIALAVVAIAWRWLYSLDGSLNAIIKAVLGADLVRPFLGDAGLALPALGVVALWATFGFVVVMLLSGTQHIPKELYEAARIDGAGPVREFFTVTLPGIRHELRVSLVMTLTLSLRIFDLPLMATQGGPGYATTTPSLMMYRDVFVNGQIGPGAAIAVLLTLVIFIGVGLVNRLVRSE
ncbi:carbohydrate ABC transporter permease [Nonomuraea sp. NPDC001684]